MKRRGALLILLLVPFLLGTSAIARDSGFFFIQIADTQLGMKTDNRDLTPEIANFREAVKDINRLKPAFVIISGDLVNIPHDAKQVRAFWSVAHEIRSDIPLYLVAGNHDIGPATEQSIKSYEKLFARDHYAFWYGGSKFIVLDSCLIHDSDSDQSILAAQRKWFEQELAAARKKNAAHIFVCTHHSWFLSSPDEKDDYFNIPQAQRRGYLDLMRRFGVDYALAGHYHREAIAHDGALTMITTSALSVPLGSTPVGFRVFHVYKGRVENTYYPLDKVPRTLHPAPNRAVR